MEERKIRKKRKDKIKGKWVKKKIWKKQYRVRAIGREKKTVR